MLVGMSLSSLSLRVIVPGKAITAENSGDARRPAPGPRSGRAGPTPLTDSLYSKGTVGISLLQTRLPGLVNQLTSGHQVT